MKITRVQLMDIPQPQTVDLAIGAHILFASQGAGGVDLWVRQAVGGSRQVQIQQDGDEAFGSESVPILGDEAPTRVVSIQ